MSDTDVVLHTGRSVSRAVLLTVSITVREMLDEPSPTMAIQLQELAELAVAYLRDERTSPVRQQELQQRLPFSYRALSRGLLFPDGEMHQQAAEVLAATFGGVTPVGHKILNPVSGRVLFHNTIE